MTDLNPAIEAAARALCDMLFDSDGGGCQTHGEDTGAYWPFCGVGRSDATKAVTAAAALIEQAVRADQKHCYPRGWVDGEPALCGHVGETCRATMEEERLRGVCMRCHGLSMTLGRQEERERIADEIDAWLESKFSPPTWYHTVGIADPNFCERHPEDES